MKRIMKKGIVLLCMSWLMLDVVNAQSVTTIQRQDDIDYNRAFRFNVKSDGLKGTPFLYDEPMAGKIALNGGKVYEDIPFNILPEKEEIYIQTGGADSDPLVLKNWEWLRTLEEDPKLFRIEYLNGKPRIVEILYETDNEKFVAVHSKYIVKPTTLKDGYTGPQYDTYKTNTRFYRIKGMSSEEFKGNTSSIKALSGSKYSEVKSFIKDNKIKTDYSEGMKQVLEFIYD